ncbi:aldehyde dehydrogenase family-domain-containing protein [Aspergillus spectabilis]
MRTAALAFNALLGIGQGYCMVVSYVTAPMLAAPADMGLINGILSAFRNLGYSILQAVFFAVYKPRLENKLVEFIPAAALQAGLDPSALPSIFQAFQAAQATGSPEAVFQVPGMTPTALLAIQGAAVDAAYNAWKFIFYIANTCVGYVQPTIFFRPAPHARVLREEIFGPGAVVDTFSTEAEALEKANDTNFGLGAVVFTRDLGTAVRVSSTLEAGRVTVNSTNDTDPGYPFGGWKDSRIGRENGRYVLEEYTQLKSIIIKY